MSTTKSNMPTPGPAEPSSLGASSIDYIRCIRTGRSRVRIWVDLFPPTSLSIPRFLSIVESYDAQLALEVGRALTEYSFFLIDWGARTVSRIFSTGEVDASPLVIGSEEAWREVVRQRKAAREGVPAQWGQIPSSPLDPFVEVLLPREVTLDVAQQGQGLSGVAQNGVSRSLGQGRGKGRKGF